MKKKTPKNQSDNSSASIKIAEEAFLASFKIDDENEPLALDPEKYGDNKGNFTGFDDDSNLWGYNEKGNFCIIPIKN